MTGLAGEATSGVSGEVVGLDQSIGYARHLAEQAGAHGPDGNEGYLAGKQVIGNVPGNQGIKTDVTEAAK